MEPLLKKYMKILAKNKIENNQEKTGMYSMVNYFGFHEHKKDYFVFVKSGILNLQEAKDLRKFASDIIVFSNTGEIVPNKEWLWDWEKEDTKSYAHKKINKFLSCISRK